MGVWRHDVLQCCWAFNPCIVSLVLPCAQYSVNQKELDPDASLCGQCVLCALCFAASPCLIAEQRESVRKRDGIDGSWGEDFVASMCCPCCVLAQIFTQIHGDEVGKPQRMMIS